MSRNKVPSTGKMLPANRSGCSWVQPSLHPAPLARAEESVPFQGSGGYINPAPSKAARNVKSRDGALSIQQESGGLVRRASLSFVEDKQ